MKMSKIFFWISGVFFACAFVLLCAHTFLSNHYFDIIHDFRNPQSEFIAKDKHGASILMVSDTGSNDVVLKEIIDSGVKSKNYDFVMYLGDLTKNASIAGYYWMLHKIKPSLGDVPMWTVAGNHDVSRRIGMSHRYEKDRALYETIMGSGHYWFGYGDTLFVVLDSADESLDDNQLVWFNDTLQKIRPMFKNCIVIGHVPPANSRPDYFSDHIMKPDTIKKFESIVRKYKINAMFFGHVHFYSHSNFAGIDFYTTPSSGQYVRNPENPNFGYISVDIDKNGKVNVAPNYIDTPITKRSAFTEWFARDVLGYRVRLTIAMALILSLLFGIGGIISRKR